MRTNDVPEARKKLWRKRLDLIVEYGLELLSEREQEFIDSLSIRFEGRDVDLTPRQSAWLSKIWERVEERLG